MGDECVKNETVFVCTLCTDGRVVKDKKIYFLPDGNKRQELYRCDKCGNERLVSLYRY
jgi:predicted RNA-binding Zn-ribbon protein involved in translation (DUF1610 family)